MYGAILGFHNLVRWIVIILAILALVTAYLGWFGKREWTRRDRLFGVLFASAMDLQLLLGLILLFSRGFSTFGQIIMYHVIPMVVAVVVVHIANVLVRRAETDEGKFRRAALWYTVVFAVLAFSIPWDRPLLPRLS